MTPSTAASSKKQRERVVLNHLLSFGRLGANLVRESEAPDFALDLDGRSIGAEVTQYVRGRSVTGSPERRQHAFIQRVLDHARLIFASENPMPLYVTVDPLAGRTVSDPIRVASQLAESVRRCLDGESTLVRPFAFDLKPPEGAPFYECAVPPLMEPIADRITIVRLPKGSYARWHIRQSGDTKAYVRELEELIASKERDLNRYQPTFDEVWLLVDAFGGDILQAITATPDLVAHCYRTGFDRVFLVDTTETTVHHLWTSAPAVGLTGQLLNKEPPKSDPEIAHGPSKQSEPGDA